MRQNLTAPPSLPALLLRHRADDVQKSVGQFVCSALGNVHTGRLLAEQAGLRKEALLAQAGCRGCPQGCTSDAIYRGLQPPAWFGRWGIEGPRAMASEWGVSMVGLHNDPQG